MRLSIAELEGELDVADFLILTWLRTAEPGAYRLIQERREEILGASWQVSRRSDQEKEAAQSNLKAALDASGTRTSHSAGVADLLGQIFPNFRAVWEGKARMNIDTVGQRVSNPDYFDRYFSLGVPEGDIRDSTVRAALAQIAAHDHGLDETKLASALGKSPDLLLGKLEVLVEDAQPQAVFVWLADHYFDIAFEPRATLSTPRERALRLASDLLARVDPPRLVDTITSALRKAGGIPLTIQAAARAFRTLDEDALDATHVPLDSSTRTTLGEHFEDAYKRLEVVDPLRMEPDLWSSIWAWANIDRPSLKRWINERQSTWGPLDLVARFVSTSRLIGGPNETRLGEVQFELLEELVDLEAIEGALNDQISAAQLPESSRSLTESVENRRFAALAQLKARQMKRQTIGDGDGS